MNAEQNEPQARERMEIAIAVVERQGAYLIGQRPDGGPLAGYWEFPGGKIARGETPEQAAVRECLEETGLTVRATGSYPSTDFEYEYASLRLHFLACQTLEVGSSLPGRFCWVLKQDLARYQFPPANASLLARLALE